MRRALALLLVALCAAVLPAAPAPAQQDDRDYLTALLEDSLSGAGRAVTITGFQGTLFSQARLARMTIADDSGIWITLTDVVLDWQRSDLLSGKITVNSLTAAEIDLARLPQTQPSVTAEAPSFALPELPVAISIGTISAQVLRLGAPLLGEPVTARATASLSLANGEVTGQLQIDRLDRDAPQGMAKLQLSYANATGLLDLDLRLREGRGGLLARAMGLPQRPALDFSAKGSGPLNDFSAQIALLRDDQAKLRGRVRLTAAPDAATPPGGTRFDITAAGDLSDLVHPDYRAFFGQSAALQISGQTRGQGGADIGEFNIATAAMTLSGQLSLDALNRPERFALSGVLQDHSAAQAPLILPLGLDRPARISRAEISAAYDQAQGQAWTAALRVENWDQGDLRMARAELAATGTLRKSAAQTRLIADLALNAEGLQPARMALSRALGHVIWGQGRVEWETGQDALALSGFRLGGEDYQITAQGRLGEWQSGLVWRGNLGMAAQDMSRFADLLGSPIRGAADLRFDGAATLLTGAFDGALHAQTKDLAIGQPLIDSSLAGHADLRLDAQRGPAGIAIRQFALQARGGQANLSGRISGQDTQVSGQFHLADMPLAARGFAGEIHGTMAMQGAFADAILSLDARTSGLDLGISSLQKLLAGKASLSARAALLNLSPSLIALNLDSAQLQAEVEQIAPGASAYRLSAKLADLGLVLSEFPGALTLQGTAQRLEQGAILSLDATGPAGLNARISGTAQAGPGNDLRLTGQADAGLMNALIAPYNISGRSDFDLALRGDLAPQALSGQIALQNGQLAGPDLPFSLRSIALQANLANGMAALTLSATPSTGGQLTAQGNVAAAAPFAAEIGLALRSIGLRNPDLYETSVSGRLQFSGPLLAGGSITGRIDLGRTEVQLRPADLIPGAPLPMLQHRGDAAATQLTRQRAGRSAAADAAAESATAPIGLDIAIHAMNRVFVRGRGLDAELGGSVRLRGTSADVRPAGSFDLVQGRFELLSKRLDLETVRLEMQGQLIPYLFVRASNVQGDITTTVVIDGPAIDPEFRFSSSPEMPEEEVLAQLLFAQNLQGLSGLQSLQLASAVASLAGRGDGLLANTRKSLGLDDLDLLTTTSGETALKLGKYVSDNVYTGLSTVSDGQQKLDFTYTLNEKIKLKTGATSQGSTSVGIEFETNY
jgi:translocation and assembly module TamB